jgi:hypothetical protein
MADANCFPAGSASDVRCDHRALPTQVLRDLRELIEGCLEVFGDLRREKIGPWAAARGIVTARGVASSLRRGHQP